MKKFLLIVYCACLLLMAGCSSPASAPVSVSPTSPPGPTATSISEQPPPPTELPERRWLNLPYVPEGGVNQKLDVYAPAVGEGPFPTILAIHGGGFRARDKGLYRQLAGYFTKLGYALVSTNYRLTPHASYPAQVEDVFCALAWVHANQTTYGLDPERIIVMGDSAGGYLAAMLGTVDTPGDYLGNCPHTLPAADWIQAAVVFYGFYDFASIDGYPAKDIKAGLEPYWGAEYGEIPPETLAEMSPLSWVDGSEPPFLLIHGVSDTSVPSWMSENFATALEKAGVEVELHLLEAGHAFILQPLSSPANRQSLEAIEAFLAARSDQ